MATTLRDTRDAIFTIELPDGRTYTGGAMSVEISTERPVGRVFRFDDDDKLFNLGPRTWEIELRGMRSLTVTDSVGLAETLHERPAQHEHWECPYCGRSWPPSQSKCWDGNDGCGANRPAMWWVKRE